MMAEYSILSIIFQMHNGGIPFYITQLLTQIILKGGNTVTFVLSGFHKEECSFSWHLWSAQNPYLGLNHLFTCTCWSLWQPWRYCISLKGRLLWRQEVGIREWWGCHIRGSYQCISRITELQWALIGWLDRDWHGEGLRGSSWLLQNGTTS